jgi:magnesium chelatase subunit I
LGSKKGGDAIARELIRAAIAKTFDVYFADADLAQIVQWFDLGGEIKLTDTASASESIAGLKKIQGLVERLTPLGLSAKEPIELQVSSAEFVLEGLHAHKRIGRSEERVFSAEKQRREPIIERERERGGGDEPPLRPRNRRSFN